MKMTMMKKYKEVGGKHYSMLNIEPVHMMVKYHMDWFQGEVLKYVSRFLNKNGIQDLRKARSVCDIAISLGDTQLNFLFTDFQYKANIEEYSKQFEYGDILNKLIPDLLAKDFKKVKTSISSLLWRYYAVSN